MKPEAMTDDDRIKIVAEGLAEAMRDPEIPVSLSPLLMEARKLLLARRPASEGVAKAVRTLSEYAGNDLRFTQPQRERLKEIADVIESLSAEAAGLKRERDEARAGIERLRSDESAWLIERGDSPAYEPAYWGWSEGHSGDDGPGFGWTTDNLAALRFGRKIDAERFAQDIGWNNVRIAEHGWCRALSPEGSPAEGSNG